MKITKSWIITISSFIFAIAAPPLADAGILISEDQITHYMMMFFGVSGIGAGMSVKKEIQKKREAAAPPPPAPAAPAPAPAPEVTDTPLPPAPSVYASPPTEPEPPKVSSIKGHELTDMGWYQTNLRYVKDVGAVIKESDPFLMIKCKGAEHMTGKLIKDKNLIQVEQGTDSITFELIQKQGGEIQPIHGELEFEFAAYLDQSYRTASGTFRVAP